MFKKFFLHILLILALSTNFTAIAATTQKPIQYTNVAALEIVQKPNAYMNKYVKINAVFNKFSTIGLDYKPAMRSSKEYISFLIKRDDVKNNVIPLSELKIFIKRDKAEKLVDLETGNKIEIKGKVFSNALGDAWMDAYEVKNLEPKPPKK